MWTECDEIADNIAINLTRGELPTTFDEALAIVRERMPDQTMTVLDNVADSLLRRGQYK